MEYVAVVSYLIAEKLDLIVLLNGSKQPEKKYLWRAGVTESHKTESFRRNNVSTISGILGKCGINKPCSLEKNSSWD